MPVTGSFAYDSAPRAFDCPATMRRVRCFKGFVGPEGNEDPELFEAVTENCQGADVVTGIVHDIWSTTVQLSPAGVDATE